MRLPEVARPHLLRLATDLQETVNVAILGGADVVYLLSEPGDRLLAARVSVGMRLPAHCTALGKCLLAQLPPDLARATLGEEPYERRTDRTFDDVERARRRPRRDPRGGRRDLRGGVRGGTRVDRRAGALDRRPWLSGDQRLAARRTGDQRVPRAAGARATGGGARDRPGEGRPGSRPLTVESGVEELTGAADQFARSLSDLVAGEPQLRYQGMPSDGDSRPRVWSIGGGRLDRDPLAA